MNIINKYLVIFILFSTLVFSQNKKDSLVQNIKYRGDIEELVKELTKNDGTQLEKARSIFYWITENIAYDYKKYNRGSKAKTFRCKTDFECEQKILAWKNKKINKVLRKKKDICDGYALLFEKMCTIAGIHCEYISGYTKQEPYMVGKKGSQNHAWNLMIIDNEYYYVDAT